MFREFGDSMRSRNVEDVMALAMYRECSSRVRFGSGLELVTFVSLNKTDVVVNQDLRLGHDAPLDLFQELHLQSCKFAHADTANPRVSGICPEAIAQTLCSNGSSRDQETMDGKRADSKGWIE